jgi:23S rRNA pseudouridine1911/1915/1917 synthase
MKTSTPPEPTPGAVQGNVLLVDPAAGHPRLDTFIHGRLGAVSRREIHLAIAQGLVRINGRRGSKGRRVNPGDRIFVGALLASPPAPTQELEIRTLYADPLILALAKPAGMPSTARRIGGRPSVAGYLLQCMPELGAVAPSPLDAGLVHRLDTETSGVLLAARTADAWRALRGQFRRKAVDKEYTAVVRGRLRGERTLTDDLEHDPRRPGVMRVATRRGSRRHWHAVSAVSPVAWANNATRLQIRLPTGVTHQIRVQLAAIGHPILGDGLYDTAPPPAAVDRLLLHAIRIRVTHPDSGAPLEVHAPLPQDFVAALGRLGFAPE